MLKQNRSINKVKLKNKINKIPSKRIRFPTIELNDYTG